MSTYSVPAAAASRPGSGTTPSAARATSRRGGPTSTPRARSAATRAAAASPRGAAGRRGGVLGAPADNDRTDLWVPLGPATVVRGQAVARPRISGRVRALAVDDSGERVYAAAANGGVWYSGDGGGSWTSLGGLAVTPASTVDAPRAPQLLRRDHGRLRRHRGRRPRLRRHRRARQAVRASRARSSAATACCVPSTRSPRAATTRGRSRPATSRAPGSTASRPARGHRRSSPPRPRDSSPGPADPADPWPKVDGAPFRVVLRDGDRRPLDQGRRRRGLASVGLGGDG